MEKHSEIEKMTAAYVLNICNVSVSQIIEYNDLYVLEQEYEAILNNLNLKKIPKDEALLRILTELLNTITFFRIQEVKKEQIEKKYQQNIKNAIWSAVPNLNVLVSGNPIAMALSVATTVGTGYMNYRREKARAESEKKDSEIELQITAIEQFDALRRELFTTAWRLADEYDFDDELRLTEKQIKQYNKILMDPDEYRKYARLEAIQDKFGAYPAFWYFFGHTANYIAVNDRDEETKKNYLELAKKHFERYEQLNKYNILREDNLTSSFALEYIDLLYLENKDNVDVKKINELNKLALENAGNSFDIIQLCTVNYLRIGNYDEAVKWLKILVNEDYNKVINAQILSGIYARKKDKVNYLMLTRRVSAHYLYPMPEDDKICESQLLESFENKQKEVLKAKTREVFKRITSKYTSRLLREISIFNLSDRYDETYFDDTRYAKKLRYNAAKLVFNDNEKLNDYRIRIQNVNLPLLYTEIFNELFGLLFQMESFQDRDLQTKVCNAVCDAVDENKDKINNIQENIINKKLELKEYEILQKIGIETFVSDAFSQLFHVFANKIDESDSNKLPALEGELLSLCNATEIEEPIISVSGDGKVDFAGNNVDFDTGMFGHKALIARRNANEVKEMVDYIKGKMEDVNIKKDIVLIYRGDEKFDSYFNDEIFKKYPQLKLNSLMIIQDIGKDHFDLIYTREGIVYVLKNKVGSKTEYKDVKLSEGSLKLNGKSYKNENIEKNVLYNIAKGFDGKFINNLNEKIEYVAGTVDGKILKAWFEENCGVKTEGIGMVLAWPQAKLIKNMGWCLEEDLDSDKYLLQCCYDIESLDIMELRIIMFDDMDIGLRKKLDKAGGVVKFKR